MKIQAHFFIRILLLILSGGCVLGALLLCLFMNYAAYHVVINEVVSNNFSVVLDPDDNEYCDYIEFYNPTNVWAYMRNCYISDKKDDAGHRMTSIKIPPKGYYVLWADGKDYGTHLPFRMARDGDGIYLRNILVYVLLAFLVWIIYSYTIPIITWHIGASYGWNIHRPFPLLIGMIYAIYKDNIEHVINHAVIPVAVVMLMIVLVTYNRFNSGVQYYCFGEQVELYELICTCIAPILINMICFVGEMKCRLLTWIGNISYELYIFHMSFYCC